MARPSLLQIHKHLLRRPLKRVGPLGYRMPHISTALAAYSTLERMCAVEHLAP